MKRYLPYIFCALLACGCAPTKPPEPEKSQLEIRQMQTREFDTSNFKLAMKSVLNVLQDENFIVKNVAMDLGFLTATKEKDIEDSNAQFWGKFQRDDSVRWPKNEITEATVNVSEFGSKIRIRVNFQNKIMDNKGAVVSVHQVTDATYYQDFFAKIDKGIFIQNQDL